MIPLVSKSEISSLWPSSVAIQPGLCRTRSETRMLVFSVAAHLFYNKQTVSLSLDFLYNTGLRAYCKIWYGMMGWYVVWYKNSVPYHIPYQAPIPN